MEEPRVQPKLPEIGASGRLGDKGSEVSEALEHLVEAPPSSRFSASGMSSFCLRRLLLLLPLLRRLDFRCPSAGAEAGAGGRSREAPSNSLSRDAGADQRPCKGGAGRSFDVNGGKRMEVCLAKLRSPKGEAPPSREGTHRRVLRSSAGYGASGGRRLGDNTSFCKGMHGVDCVRFMSTS